MIKSGIEQQPSMILTATWCLWRWDKTKIMLMRHAIVGIYAREQPGHFARACRMHMWHTAAEDREIWRMISTLSAKRPT